MPIYGKDKKKRNICILARTEECEKLEKCNEFEIVILFHGLTHFRMRQDVRVGRQGGLDSI